MTYNTEIHHRRSIRLKNYNYSQSGIYFITLCTHNREHLFGEIVNDEMVLNELGKITQIYWQNLTKHYFYLQLDEFIIMPNHLHGIIILQDDLSNRAEFGHQNRVGFGHQNRAGFEDELSSSAEIWAKPAPTEPADTTEPGKRKGIPEIVRGFKTFSARPINRVRRAKNIPVWQRNYYERIIRNQQELENVREYIINNPKKWSMDKNNIGCI